jgi:hypothetical protein
MIEGSKAQRKGNERVKIPERPQAQVINVLEGRLTVTSL